MRVGPYELKAHLGDGGMGVVHRAVDRRTGAEVALKMVKVSDAGRVDGIRREIAALRRLHHPGIVRIVDSGVQDGRPWYAMTLQQGRSLREHLQRAGAAPGAAEAPTCLLPPAGATEAPTDVVGGGAAGRRRAGPLAPLRHVLCVVRRLCGPLRYLHGEGVVHRDLKPGNVVVTDSGDPVLIDFGLATVMGSAIARDELGIIVVSGTAAYMAPEQTRGELVDARTDLYALGCVLHELLTGAPPFPAPLVREVMRQHRELPPQPPSTLVEGIPPGVDELVLALLEKEPSRRPGFADDVAAALGRLGADDVDDGDDGDGHRAPAPRTYVYRPRLRGREGVVTELAEVAARLHCSRPGAFFLLAAQSGLGKTRLVTEVASRAAQSGVEVLLGSCDGRSREPLQGMRGALALIADRCREGGLLESEAILGARGRLLGMYEPSILSLPGQDRHPEPAPLPEGAAQARLFGSLRTTLAELATRSPTLLVVEDVHAADGLTMGFLSHLAQSAVVETLPLMVVVTARSEEPTDAVTSLAGQVRRLELRPLDAGEVAAVVSDMLAMPEPPPELCEAMWEASEGNPLFVAEYLRAAVASGALRRDARGRFVAPETGGGTAAALPGSLRELIADRLRRLSPDARRVLDAASVLGLQIDVAVLLAMVEMPAESSLEAFSELVARQVVEDPAHRQPRFTHAKVREVAYGSLDAAASRALHGAAAAAMEALQGGRREADLEMLAMHWEAAGDVVRALECYLASGRAAFRRFAHDVAEASYGRYLALAAAPSRGRVAATWERALYVHHRLGRTRQAEEECRAALREAEVLPDDLGIARVLRALASIQADAGDLDGAVASLSRARGLAEDDAALAANCVGVLANVRKSQGHLEEARSLYLDAIDRSRRVPDRPQEGVWHGNLAALRVDMGDYADALGHYDEALSVAREHRQRRAEGVWLGNRGNLLRELGRLPEARDAFEQALGIAREMDDPRSEAIWHGGLGSIALEEEDATRARGGYERALALARQVGDRRHEGYCLAALAWVDERRGDAPGARASLGLARAVADEMGDVRLRALVLLRSATVGTVAGDPAEGAGAALTESLGLLTAAGDRAHAVQALCALGHVALGEGRSAAAELARARELASPWMATPAAIGLRRIARLERAERRFAAGLPLVRGHDPEDVAPR